MFDKRSIIAELLRFKFDDFKLHSNLKIRPVLTKK